VRGVRRRKSAPHLEHILTMLEREGTAKHEREGIKFTCVLCYLRMSALLVVPCMVCYSAMTSSLSWTGGSAASSWVCIADSR
jgi:hypothetical protein